MRWLPTAAEERLLELRSRSRRWKRAGWIDEGERQGVEAATATPWKVFSLLPRIGLFLLSSLAAVATRFFFENQMDSDWYIVIGIALVAAAELLIARRGFFRTGIEEGLWCAGLLVILFDGFRLAGSAMSIFVWVGFAAGLAFFLLSFRLVHTLLLLAAIAILVNWMAGFYASPAIAGWALLSAGAIALAIHLGEAERPFREHASGWLALGAPAVAWALVRGESPPAAYAIALGCAAIWILAGVRRRARFALAGGALAAMAFGYEMLEPRPWAIEWKLIAGGTGAFAAAVAIERWLRTPRRGVTSLAMDADAEPALLEMVAVAAIAPAATSGGKFDGEGGKFGGGGASGEY